MEAGPISMDMPAVVAAVDSGVEVEEAL
jgi:hypothetical protein